MSSKRTTNHPFYDGLRNPPEGKQKELIKIKNWLQTQPHLPQINDDYIYLFLHACFYCLDRTKLAIENYFTIKSRTPNLFGNRNVDLPSMRNCMDLAYVIRLPELTPDGSRVLLYTVKDPDYTKLVFSDAIKGFCMFNDCVLSEDGLVDGYIVLFDMKGLSIGHVARVELQPLKAFLAYIQEAHPARLKAIHVLNTANYINHIMRIVMPLIRSEFLSYVKFHKGNVADGVPIALMPKEYGGDGPSIKDLDKQTMSYIDKYRQWLLDSETFQVDEDKRVKKASWWSSLIGGSPTQLPSIEIQKKNFLENLQID